jgi:PAS domain S-box-containing protein
MGASDRFGGDSSHLLLPLKTAPLGDILNSIGDGVMAIDCDGNVTYINATAEEATGWPAGEAIGSPLQTVLQVIDGDQPEPRSPFRRNATDWLAPVLRHGETLPFAPEAVLLGRDGHRLAIQGSVSPLVNEPTSGPESGSPNVVGATVIFRDVTDQRIAQQMRQAALDYADDIIATLRHPFLVLDEQHRVQSSNRAFYETFQVSPGETRGKLLSSLGNGQWDIPRLRQLLNELILNNTELNGFEIHHDFPRIGRRYMTLNARRIHREAEHCDLILLGIEDITERRQLEEARRELETRFTSLVKNVRDHAIFTLDSDGMIQSWNLEAERILGYSETDAVGQHFSVVFTDEDRQRGVPELEMQLARQNGRAEDERWHRKADGGTFWALGILTPTHDPQGNFSGYAKILRDMTERKQMELALRESHRYKDEFLAMLSHELRNPLAPILSALELIKESSDETPEHRTARTIIARQTRHLARLVDDLLEVSRVSTGKVSLQRAKVKLNDIVGDAIDQVRVELARHGQTLNRSITRPSVWVDADPTRLQQVISNLLINASKYSDSGSHIDLSLHEQAGWGVVQVRDHGKGIDTEMLPRIFDLFSQADVSLHRSQGGLGIGLALVKSLVEAHGGSVEAHSEGLGCGSQFVVRLPSVSAPEQNPASDDADESPREDAAAVVPRRVLVIEDQRDAAKVTAVVLRSWGHEVCIAHSGAEGIRRAAQFLPHLVLSDIGLPDVDGYQVARQLRSDPRFRETRLVAVTGYGQQKDLQRSRQSGFDEHLVKPVDPADFKRLLSP